MFTPSVRTYAYASWYSVLSTGVGISALWLSSL